MTLDDRIFRAKQAYALLVGCDWQDERCRVLLDGKDNSQWVARFQDRWYGEDAGSHPTPEQAVQRLIACVMRRLVEIRDAADKEANFCRDAIAKVEALL